MNHKIKVSSFTSELEKGLDRAKRTFCTIETEIYEVANSDNQDGTFSEIYRAKLVGSTVIQQTGLAEKIIGKSKRSRSQQLKSRIWVDNADEDYYDCMMAKLIANWPEVVIFLKNL
jgi:hypothetical protein